MGRFDTLNPDTQDLVETLLPALAAAFHVRSALEIIPFDIRMRAWDCEKRDHIKDETENDPRNWGVQFLKDLKSIARLNGGDVDEFHSRLRAKVQLHEPKHPWCRLADIKELKDEYENPNRLPPQPKPESSVSSVDSYLEELHEPDMPRGTKRKGVNEVYEARVQAPRRRRLRRLEDGTLYRKDKHADKRQRMREPSTPDGRFRNIVLSDEDEDETNATRASVSLDRRRSAFSGTPTAFSHSEVTDAVNASTEPLEVQKLQAELEVAEAELRAARLKYQYIQAKEAAERDRI